MKPESTANEIIPPLFLCEHRRPLMLGDLFICVYSYYQVIAHSLGLSQGVGVAKVNHVVATKVNVP